MPIAFSSLSDREAWQPLPVAQWDAAAARHLLQRAGFAATPATLQRALDEGLAKTLSRCFGAMPTLAPPSGVGEMAESDLKIRKHDDSLSPDERRAAQRRRREHNREGIAETTLAWLELASRVENSAAEKWLLFLSDVWVVGARKVTDAGLIFGYQDTLRKHALGPAPKLAEAMSRNPGMIRYLDLQQSGKDAPNENFAREFFELFTLGEGHYSEQDIKQAARAFTGYRVRDGEFLFAPRQHDAGEKTIFGQRGAFDGDDVVRLAFAQPAAASFLPREMVRFYLTDTPLTETSIAALGGIWAAHGFDLRQLALTFFSSRAFYADDFRDRLVKSPVQFYLGLVQDLELDPMPLQRRVLAPLRQMGQMPFDPPNVRGWVGGRAWINSATLTVRRQMIAGLLQPFDEEKLNADERAALDRARSKGASRFFVPPDQLAAWAREPAPQLAGRLTERFLPGRVDAGVGELLAQYLQAKPGKADTVRGALAALLESPAYQLC